MKETVNMVVKLHAYKAGHQKNLLVWGGESPKPPKKGTMHKSKNVKLHQVITKSLRFYLSLNF
jgi:hypothetical protein